MANVFISYSRRDRDRVVALAAALEGEGLSVWWDPNLIPGRRFREMIATELAAADCVVVVWTAASLESDWVQDEAEEARTRGTLIPVKLEPVKAPPGFRQLQAADLSQWTGSPQHPEFKSLVLAVKLLADIARNEVTQEAEIQAGSAVSGVASSHYAAEPPVLEPKQTGLEPVGHRTAASETPALLTETGNDQAAHLTGRRPDSVSSVSNISAIFLAAWALVGIATVITLSLLARTDGGEYPIIQSLIFSIPVIIATILSFSVRKVNVRYSGQIIGAVFALFIGFLGGDIFYSDHHRFYGADILWFSITVIDAASVGFGIVVLCFVALRRVQGSGDARKRSGEPDQASRS